MRSQESALRYANNRDDIHALRRAAAVHEESTFIDTPYTISAARVGAFMARVLCNAPALRNADVL